LAVHVVCIYKFRTIINQLIINTDTVYWRWFWFVSSIRSIRLFAGAVATRHNTELACRLDIRRVTSTYVSLIVPRLFFVAADDALAVGHTPAAGVQPELVEMSVGSQSTSRPVCGRRPCVRRGFSLCVFLSLSLCSGQSATLLVVSVTPSRCR